MDKLWFKTRRAISVLLVFAMLASITPVQAFAEEGQPSAADTTVSTMSADEEAAQKAAEEAAAAEAAQKAAEEAAAAEAAQKAAEEAAAAEAAQKAAEEAAAAEAAQKAAEEAAAAEAAQKAAEEVAAAEAAQKAAEEAAAAEAAQKAAEEAAQKEAEETADAVVEGENATEAPVVEEVPATEEPSVEGTPVEETPVEEAPALVGYTVKYLDKATEEGVAEETAGEAAVGETIAIEAPEVEGYTLCADQPTELVLAADAENVATVYYEVAEVAMPAQTLTATAADGATVTIDAPEGALPAGTTVQITIMDTVPTVEGVEFTQAVAYDVTLWNNGVEVQPAVAVSVKMSNVPLAAQTDSLEAYHLADDGSVDKGNVQGDKSADFSLNSFSPIVVFDTQKSAEESGDVAANGAPEVATYGLDSSNSRKPGKNITLEVGKTYELGIGWNAYVEDTDVAEVYLSWGKWYVKAKDKGETTVTVEHVYGPDDHYRLTVTDSSSQPGDKGTIAYFYFLKPGCTADPYKYYNYYYLGTGSVDLGSTDGVPDGHQVTDDVTGHIISYPNGVYNDFTWEGKTYTYDPTGSGAAGTYTVNWYRIINSSGANNGNNGTDQKLTDDMVWHVDGSITLYDEGQYTVSFQYMDTDGKVKEAKNAVIKESEQKTIADVKPSMSEKGEYVFEGWYTDSNFTTKVDETEIISSNMTVYGRYVPKTQTATITFDDGVDDDSVKNMPDTLREIEVGEYQLPAALNVPVREGYDFTGWKVGETTQIVKAGDTITLTEDVTLTAQWSIKTYKITYELDEGTNHAENPDEYTIETDTITLKEPTKTGHEFLGWTYEGHTNPTKTVTIPKGSTGDKTFTANWKAKAVEVYIDYYYETTPGAWNKSFTGNTTKSKNYGETLTIGVNTTAAEDVDAGLRWNSSTGLYVFDSIRFTDNNGNVIGDLQHKAQNHESLLSAGLSGSVTLTEDVVSTAQDGTLSVTIAVCYTTDYITNNKASVPDTEKKDNIPDKYQAIAKFVLNPASAGTWESVPGHAVSQVDSTIQRSYTIVVTGYDATNNWTSDIKIQDQDAASIALNADYVEPITWSYNSTENVNTADEISNCIGYAIRSNTSAGDGMHYFFATPRAAYQTISARFSHENSGTVTAKVNGQADGTQDYSWYNNKIEYGSGVELTFTAAEYHKITSIKIGTTNILEGTLPAGVTVTKQLDENTKECIGATVTIQMTGDAYKGYTIIAYAEQDPTAPRSINVNYNLLDENDVDAIQAVFTQNPENVNLNYGENKDKTTVTYYYDQSATIPVNEYKGYKFLGYAIEILNEGDVVFTEQPSSGTTSTELYEDAVKAYGPISITLYYEKTATFEYTASPAAGGKLSSDGETVGIVTGTPTGSTATAAPGYDFKGWTSDGVSAEEQNKLVPQKKTVDADGNRVQVYASADYVANFAESAAVTITYEALTGGKVDGEAKTSEEVKPVTGIPVGATAQAEPGYHFVEWRDAQGKQVGTTEQFVPSKNSQNIYETATYYAYFEENPAVTIKYVTDGNGSVSNSSESVKPVTGIPAGSTATANTGYVFVNWTDESGNVVSTNANFVPGKNTDGVYVAQTYTAHFALRSDYTYTVRYLEDGTARELASPKTVGGQTLGATVTETAINIGGYTLTSDKNPQSITIGTGENVITFYYKEVGPDVEPTPTPTETPTAPVAPPTTPTGGGTTTTATATPAPTEEEEVTEEPIEEEVIEEEETPLAEEPAEEETIGEEETPLAGGNAAWALLNLILAILTVLGSALLLIGYLGKKRKEDEEGEEEYTVKKNGFWRLISLIPAIAAVVAFVLTEDMSMSMAFVDRWTLLMVIIAVIQIVVAVLSMKEKQEPEEE